MGVTQYEKLIDSFSLRYVQKDDALIQKKTFALFCMLKARNSLFTEIDALYNISRLIVCISCKIVFLIICVIAF